MATVDVGFFGKLPSRGDFIERRVSAALRDVWDAWLEQCIDASRRTLGDQWLDYYLTSPIWRFFLCDGIAGAASYGGVLVPSVDRVGRYFPLTVVVQLPIDVTALSFAEAAVDWFEEVERLCSSALEEPEVDLQAFDEALAASADLLAGVDELPAPPAFPGRTAQWRWPIASTREVGAALSHPLIVAAHASLRPLTMWWTDGSERIAPSALLVRGLPRPDSFASLLAGGWDERYWDGQLVDEVPAAPQDWRADGDHASSLLGTELVAHGAGKTDMGTVRTQNQDNLLVKDEHRLWAVADGMGGHSHGEVASQMVVDALNAAPEMPTLNTALKAVNDALQGANGDLRRAAKRAGEGQRIGSTVVVLQIRGDEWAVSWAGDSRIYLYRGGTLTQLTRDHTVAAAAASLGIIPAGSSGEITRAVGGDDTLEVDSASDHLRAEDRFLLCSDGLYGALPEAEILGYLTLPTPEATSIALIEAAREAGASDNVTALVVDVKALDPQVDATAQRPGIEIRM
jgi:type VI secretion system protein ImpM